MRPRFDRQIPITMRFFVHSSFSLLFHSICYYKEISFRWSAELRLFVILKSSYFLFLLNKNDGCMRRFNGPGFYWPREHKNQLNCGQQSLFQSIKRIFFFTKTRRQSVLEWEKTLWYVDLVYLIIMCVGNWIFFDSITIIYSHKCMRKKSTTNSKNYRFFSQTWWRRWAAGMWRWRERFYV